MPLRTLPAVLLLPLLVLTACGGGGDDAPVTAGDEAPGVTAEAQAGEGNGVDGNGAGAGGDGECADVDGPIIAVESRDGEPQVEIPLPEDWERTTQTDSEMIRLMVGAPSIGTGQFVPNVVVTAEPSGADVDAAFEAQLTGIRQGFGIEDITTTEGTICGHPSMVAEYTAPAMGAVPERSASVQIIVVPGVSGSTTYTMTAQSTAPVDPSFEEDVTTIFEGVQIED